MARYGHLARRRVTVNININVVDGVSGRPAEGVDVNIVGQSAEEWHHCIRGLTDSQGNFTYSSGAERLPARERYTVELDVDAYFTSLGLMAGYRQISLLVRIAGAEKDYRIVTLITPFAHATWSVR